MWLCLDTWWELHALLFCYSFSSSPAAWRLYVIYRIEMLKLKGLFHFWDSCLALNLNYRSLWNIFSFLYLRKHWGVLVGLNPSAISTTLNCHFVHFPRPCLASLARRERVKEREMGTFYPVNSFQLIGPPEYNRLPVRQSKITRCGPRGEGEI